MLLCPHLRDLCTHPAGPHAGHAPGADVVVRDDAVLDAERAEADVAHALLTRLVRHDGSVHLHHTAQLSETPADTHLHQRVGDVALVQSEAPASQPSLVPVGIVVLVLATQVSGAGTPETVCNPHHGGQTRGPDPLPPAGEGGVVLQLEDGEVVLEQRDADRVAVIVSEERVVSAQPDVPNR